MNTQLDERMKMYEDIESKRILIPKLPICVRVDGRGFSKFTKDMIRPFDKNFTDSMIETMKFLIEETDAIIGYTQSDEISLILSDIKEPFFKGRVSKLNSIIASMATAKFNELIHKHYPNKPLAFFDCRAWNVPNRTEAANTLLWRYLDCIKNSISMATYHIFSEKELINKNSNEKIKMLLDKGIDWNKYNSCFKYGTFARKELIQHKFTPEEIELLPPMHNARKNPDIVVNRNVIQILDFQNFNKFENRTEILFENAKPIINENS